MSNMFKEKGYEVVKGFLEPGFIEFIHEYVYTKIRGGVDAHVAYGDPQSPNSFALYGDALMDTVLSMSRKMMSIYLVKIYYQHIHIQDYINRVMS